MSRESDLSELDIQVDLERLLGDWDSDRDGSEALDREALDRETLEALGLLPYALEPEVPREALKSEILTRIQASAAPTSTKTASETEAPPTAAQPLADFASHRARRTDSAAPSRGNTWRQWALAAALGVCLLGLGYFSGRVGELSRTVDQLNVELAEARAQPVLPVNLHDRFSVIPRIAPQAYPMRTTEGGAQLVSSQTGSADQPNGIVYVCPKHEAWSVSLNGLEEPPVGFQYRLWFLTDEGAKAGEILQRNEHDQYVLKSPEMPLGTRSFGVSREPVGENQPGEPTSTQWVLRAEPPIRL